MEIKYLRKIIALSIIFILIGVGISPVINSEKTIKEEKNDGFILNILRPNKNEAFYLDSNEYEIIKNLLKDLIQYFIFGEGSNNNLLDLLRSYNENDNPLIEKIINFIKSLFQFENLPNFLKKSFIISQGWSNNINFFKKSRYELKRNAFSFWHYTQESNTGGESKTLIFRPDKMFMSQSAELYKGRQTGFMYKPVGIYIHQSKMYPKTSYTFFIGLANFALANADTIVELNPPSEI